MMNALPIRRASFYPPFHLPADGLPVNIGGFAQASGLVYVVLRFFFRRKNAAQNGLKDRMNVVHFEFRLM